MWRPTPHAPHAKCGQVKQPETAGPYGQGQGPVRGRPGFVRNPPFFQLQYRRVVGLSNQPLLETRPIIRIMIRAAVRWFIEAGPHLSPFPNRMLKKSIPGLFQAKLARASIANSAKLHDFSSRPIWRAVHGPLIRVFFNTLLKALASGKVNINNITGPGDAPRRDRSTPGASKEGCPPPQTVDLREAAGGGIFPLNNRTLGSIRPGVGWRPPKIFR